MIIDISLDRLMKKCDTRYSVVTVAAKRSRELSEAPNVAVADRDTNKTLSRAMEEIADGKIQVIK